MKLCSKLLSFKLMAVCAFCLPTSLWAADGADALQQLLKPLASLQGNFSQQQFDSDGELLLQSEGDFSLQRPGKFSWHTVAPFEQQLISNGQTLWLYDPDLEQVSVQKVDANLQQTPALILSGNTEKFSENFEVIETPAVDESNLFDGDVTEITLASDKKEFLLLPRQAEAVFERLVLTFDKGILSQLKVHDSLGQLTQFDLLKVSANQSVDLGSFEFMIPEGTEVITDE